MNFIEVNCDDQLFHVYLTPYLGPEPNNDDPIIIEPTNGVRCTHYGFECSRCAMFHSPSCSSYKSVLAFITSTYPTQFQDYPELLV